MLGKGSIRNIDDHVEMINSQYNSLTGYNGVAKAVDQ